MPMQLRLSRALYAFVLLASLSVPLHAQTIDDGIMLARHELLTGNVYSRESWDEYWEGTLKRANGNIGRVTTTTNVWTANYGLANRLNVIAAVPYMWTRASQGVLHGIEGFQDITLAAKYNFLEKSSNYGSLKAIGVLSAGIPLTDYNPELLPLSIGTGSTRVSWRGTVNFQSNPGWYLNGSAAYTWRSQTKLDRPYYYTDDQFVMSNEVDMPNVVDSIATAGYMKPGRLMAEVFFTQQRTLGGGDIRRQDMPFVSNRMNFFKVGAMMMAPIPKLRVLEFQLAVAETISGRNVGQSKSFTAGLLYRLNGGRTQ